VADGGIVQTGDIQLVHASRKASEDFRFRGQLLATAQAWLQYRRGFRAILQETFVDSSTSAWFARRSRRTPSRRNLLGYFQCSLRTGISLWQTLRDSLRPPP
jgi:hypothetical protein